MKKRHSTKNLLPQMQVKKYNKSVFREEGRTSIGSEENQRSGYISSYDIIHPFTKAVIVDSDTGRVEMIECG